MKRNYMFFVLISACLLFGCQNKLPEEKAPAEKGTVDHEEAATLPVESASEEAFAYPTVVKLMDPRTMEIVQTISTHLLGYGTDDESYTVNLKKIAYELARGTADRTGYDQSMVLDKLGKNGEIEQGMPGTILKEANWSTAYLLPR